jgi:hypothetical protein
VTTAAQTAANRRNAQKSTGPRTDEGKACSATNALRHGGYARANAITASVLDEDPQEIDTLIDAIVEELDPGTPMESIAAHNVANRILNQMRVDRLTAPLAEGTDPEGNWEIFVDGYRFKYQYGLDLDAALAAIDGKDIPSGFDWVWLIRRIQILEARGEWIEFVQTWPDGSTRLPQSLEEWIATASAAIHRNFEDLEEAQERADQMLMYRDEALAEERAERAEQAQRLLDHFERTTQLGDRVDRSVTKALDAYNKLRANRPDNPPDVDGEE